MHDYEEFPLLGSINQKRVDYFEKAHNGANPFIVRVGSWLGHKGIYLIAIPLNIAGLVAGAALTVVSTCIVGAIKVVTYMATRGNRHLDFGTGFVYFGEKTVLCGVSLIVISLEIVADIYFVFAQTAWGFKWTLDKTYITSLFFNTIHYSGRLLQLASKLIVSSINNTRRCEQILVYKGFPGLRKIDNLTRLYRIDSSRNTRPLSTILIHYGFSAVNIPLHILACAVASVAATIFSTIFVLKILISTTTTLDIPIPSAAPYMLQAVVGTAKSVALDTLTDIVDLGVLVYKVTEAAGLNQLFRKKTSRRAALAT